MHPAEFMFDLLQSFALSFRNTQKYKEKVEFTRPCGLSSPPFARCVASSQLVPRSFSLWALV